MTCPTGWVPIEDMPERPLTKESVMASIKRQRVLYERCEEQNYDKLQYSNPYRREIERLESILEFLDFDVDLKPFQSGTVLVNNKYIFCLRTHKWRVDGRNTWYRSSGATDFLKRFVKAKPKEKNT